MRRLASLTIATLGAASAHAQFLQTTYGGNIAVVQSYLENYDSGHNDTFAFLQGQDIENPLNTDSLAADPAWSATNLAGSASGNGEAAYAHGVLTNGASSATYRAYLSATADLASNITGEGPYYGITALSQGSGYQRFNFTTTVATDMTITGEVTGVGSTSQELIQLFNMTDGTLEYTFVTDAPGGTAINVSQQLTSGDAYELNVSTFAGGSVAYDAGGLAQNLQGATGSTTYLTTTFLPAPEPLSCGLLGLGALALIRRRKR